MAIKNLQSVYAVAESNHLAAVKTGEIFAQYQLNASNFTGTKYAENGMLLVVDHVAKDVKLPAGITATGIHLHLSVEKDYENKGRKYFAVKPGEYLPRLYKLKVGDIFETNAVVYDDTVYANYAAMTAAINATTVYGIPDTSGNIKIVAAPGGTEATVLKVVEGVTLPNGESGFKFVVNKVG
jgi:hypothetical protein